MQLLQCRRLILQRLFDAGQRLDLAIRLDHVQEQQQTNDEPDQEEQKVFDGESIGHDFERP